MKSEIGKTIRNVFVCAGLFIGVGAAMAGAASVTVKEAELDGVFSQQSFQNRNMPIDIRVNATRTIFGKSHLLDINTGALLDEAFQQTQGFGRGIGMLFVDTVDFCVGFNVFTIGCGTVGGPGLIVESAFAAGNNGTELLAHEIGHNLGLGHGGTGLMGPSINGSTALSANEVTTILNSSLVQQDSSGKYIEINPILISALVPEIDAASGMGSLAALGALLMFVRERRRGHVVSV